MIKVYDYTFEVSTYKIDYCKVNPGYYNWTMPHIERGGLMPPGGREDPHRPLSEMLTAIQRSLWRLRGALSRLNKAGGGLPGRLFEFTDTSDVDPHH